MRNLIVLSLLFLLAFTGSDKPIGNKKLKNSTFGIGETLTYRASIGIIHAAEATFQVDDRIHTVNGRPNFKIDVYAKTVGIFDVFQRVRDNWGTMMDTTHMIPHRSYRYIEEGKYRKNEIVNFEQDQNKAVLSKLDKVTRKVKETENFNVPENVQDLVSGYYYFRLMDFSKLQKGDTVSVKGFFDSELYDMKIVFEGKESLNSKLGEFKTLVFYPVMKQNKIFGSDNPVKMWISDDKNRIPLKIKVNLFVGSVDMDLKSFANLRYPLNEVAKR